jgi:hypothetical protein
LQSARPLPRRAAQEMPRPAECNSAIEQIENIENLRYEEFCPAAHTETNTEMTLARSGSAL